MLPITSFFAALLAGFFMVLSFRVIRLRRQNKAAAGDAGVSALQMAIRAHGNFAEYTPMFLILLALAEMANIFSLLLWLVGSVFCAGRLLHAYGLCYAEHYENGQLKVVPRFRIMGMMVTLSMLGMLAGCLLLKLHMSL